MGSFPETLKRIRAERNMTQEQLATLLGTTKQNISRYESGEVSPILSTAVNIADKLGISLSELSGKLIDEETHRRLQAIRESLKSPFETEGWKQLSNGIRQLSLEKRKLPDYERAALGATEALIKYKVQYPPVTALPMLKSTPEVIVMSYTELASIIGLARNDVLEMMGAGSKDALTFVKEIGGKLWYVVAYNMLAPFYVLQYALACEFGHIVMRHDGSKDDDVRAAEVACFANYLLFPRQLLQAGKDANIPLTVANLGRAMGCYEQCLETVRVTPGVKIPKELNRIVRGQFEEYINNYLEIQGQFFRAANSPLADLGTYMDNYEE